MSSNNTPHTRSCAESYELYAKVTTIQLSSLSKILTTRLQTQISNLMDLDQTCFIKRALNHRKFRLCNGTHPVLSQSGKTPTLVVKLDFAKAFHTGSWEALDSVIQVRGFTHIWPRWMRHIAQSSRSAVLVNGCPGFGVSGKGIPCHHISSFLWRMCFRSDEQIRHPIIAGTSCPVLQYADDTLVLVRAELHDIQRLRTLLDHFAQATGFRLIMPRVLSCQFI